MPEHYASGFDQGWPYAVTGLFKGERIVLEQSGTRG